VLAREPHHLTCLGFRDVARVDASHSDSLGVNVKHDFVGRGGVVLKELHKNIYDENLRCVVVVVKHDLVEARLFHLDLLKGRNLALVLGGATWHGFQCA